MSPENGSAADLAERGADSKQRGEQEISTKPARGERPAFYTDHRHAITRLGQDQRATVGLLVDPTQLTLAEFNTLVRADEWRELALAAYSSGRYLISVGRPWTAEAGGCHYLAHDRADVAQCVLAANERVANAGSTFTYWLLFVDDLLRDEIQAELAAHMPCAGNA